MDLELRFLPFLYCCLFLTKLQIKKYLIISLCTGNPKMGTLANSEDSDEMLQFVAFHQVCTVC